MPAPTRLDAETVPAATTRPGGLWSRPSRPVEARNTAFGSTVFDPVGSAEPSALPSTPDSAFDVCHAGVVLRAVAFVHVALAIGVAFTATSVGGWLAQAALGSSIAVPALLAWLLLACGLRHTLGGMSLPVQWLAAVGLGALAAGGSASVIRGLPLNGAVEGPQAWLAPALAGAGLAAALFQWLHLRAKAALPAETTARLAELQSRIRPHFLFNTLNTALSLVRLDPARAEGVLEDLAELFRVALNDSGDSASLGDEVELAQRYLAIEQIRFGPRLKVQWDLDPGAAAARLPPLLLQPLVENAVRHGVEPAAEGGSIRVRTQVRHGRAVVSIANTLPREPSRPGHGMALDNVRERLRLMHDLAAQFDTQVADGSYRVQIVVPI